MSVPCSDTYVPICQFLSRWSGFQMVYYAFRLISKSESCRLRLGTRPGGLASGEIQAVTTHRPNSNSWVPRRGRALIVKGVVGRLGGLGRRGIRALAELGPGEMNACLNEGVGSGPSRAAEMRRLEPMSGTACDVQLSSIENLPLNGEQ